MKKAIAYALIVALTLTCIMGSAPFAYATGLELSNSVSQKNSLIYGCQDDNLSNIFNGVAMYESVVINNFDLRKENNQFFIKGQITTAQGESININTSGSGYVFATPLGKKTNLIDFTSSSDIHFVQARADQTEANTILNLTLQLTSTEEFIYFEIPLNNTFSNALKAATVSENSEYKEKAFELYYTAKNFITPDTSQIHVSGSSDGDVQVRISDCEGRIYDTRARYDTTVPKDVWTSFFYAIEYVNNSIDTYAIDTRILNEGWIYLDNMTATSERYSIACHTTQNGMDQKMMQLTLLDVVPHRSDPTYASTQIRIEHRCCFAFNEDTEEFELIYLDLGVRITDLHLALYIPGGSTSTTVFTTQKVTGDLTIRTTPNPIQVLLCYVPQASAVSTTWSLWDDLTEPRGTTSSLNHEYDYEDTYDLQAEAYGEEVIRVIAGATGSSYLSDNDDYFKVYGSLYNGRSNCVKTYFTYTGML